MGKEGKTGEIKKPVEGKAEGAPGGAKHAPAAAPVAKGVGQKVGCLVLTCKDKDVRHSFCNEHFKQFKFGLITKLGLPVSDFEKKFEHYQQWLRAQKVA